MTAIALSGSASRTRSSSRVMATFRLHLVNYETVIVLPWLIMAFIFVVNWLIWWMITRSLTSASDLADAREGFGWSGAMFFIFVYMMVVAVQAVNLTFPLAQGYGVTRRDFYLGTSLAFVALSVAFALVLTLLSFVEEATDGWGVGGSMFTLNYFGGDVWYERLWMFLVVFLFFFFIGAATAAIYVRWHTRGMYAFFAALGLLLVGSAAVATLTRSWPAVGDWFVSVGVDGLVLWSLLPTAVSAVVGYLILRRATPRE
jgi:hypothetical protein